MSARRRRISSQAYALEAPPYNPDPAVVTSSLWKGPLESPTRCTDETPHRFELDAKLFFGRFSESGRLLDYELRRFIDRGKVRREHRRLKEAARSVRLREVGELDWFAYGSGAIPYLGSNESPLTGQYLPLMPGPATRQQYWADYFASSAKCFEAYHHDPLAHRAVNLLAQFVLGKGVEAKASSDAAQAAWDRFWDANDMDARLAEMCRDLSIFGELMLRYFPTPAGLLVRSLDPASIYEIVSDHEDWESVFFYHQQFQTRSELFAPPGGNIAPTGPTSRGTTKFVIRQIPADEIDHIRINATGSEVRGRSDLFSALGYLKRLRDLMTSRVVKADMEARMVYQLIVDGSQGDVDDFIRKLFPHGRPPAPGTVLGTNENVKLEAFEFTKGETQVRDDIEALINLVAVGIGVPKEYLGIQGHGTRATALVATEPAAKLFEDRQKVATRILKRMAGRVFAAQGIRNAEIEFTFPSIVTEDRGAKLKDLAFAESNSWLSKERVATIAAKELDLDTYDFDHEQRAIADEWKDAGDDDDGQGDGTIRRPLISAQYRQAPKLDPTRAGSIEDLPPGDLVPEDGSDPEGATRGGIPAEENPATGAGAESIRKDGKVKESAVPVSAVSVLLREAIAAGRAPRRRPDDPRFKEHASEYRKQARANLEQLVESASE